MPVLHVRKEVDDVLVSRIQDQVVAVERISENIAEQIVGVLVAQIREDIVQVSQVCSCQRVAEQSVFVL